jgi:hydrogenase maturation factor
VNLLYAEVVEVFAEGASRMAKVRVGGALKKVCLDLLTDTHQGETVFLCDGVALSKVDERTKMEAKDVSGNTR